MSGRVKNLRNMGYDRLWIDEDFDGYILHDGTSHYDMFTKDGVLIGCFCPHDLGDIEETEPYQSLESTTKRDENE